MRLRMVAGAIGVAAALVGAAVTFPAYAAAGAPDRCAGLPAHGTSPVVDAAGVVPADAEAALAAELAAYHDAGNEAIVAVTVHDLGGDDVASYAKRLFTCWGVGDKGSDNGVLILVAMAEHRTRIELGAGLAQRIPDESLSLAVEAMTPPLRQGDVAGGLRAAAVAVADDLGTPLAGGTVAAPGDVSGGVGLPPAVPAGGGVDDGFTAYGSGGSGFGLAVLIPFLILIAFAVAIGKVVAGAGGGGWGGFPRARGYRYWDAPTMFHAGRWSDHDTTTMWSSHASGMSGSSGGSGSMSSGSSGAGGGSFGGGSSGGGGASGSW